MKILSPSEANETCTKCRNNKAITIIEGGYSCDVCGNKIHLCELCLKILEKEIKEFIESNDTRTIEESEKLLEEKRKLLEEKERLLEER